MSQNDVIEAKIRTTSGSRDARRMRAQGQIPAVLYGHGQETVNLAVPSDQIEATLRHGGKVVDFQGDVKDSALIIDVQFDAFGNDVLHLDFARVSKGEMVETTVPIELRGDAPGTRAGGMIEQSIHEIEIRCPVSDIPERIEVSINQLDLNQAITVAELGLPETVEALLEPSAVVVQCTEVAVVEEVEEEAVAAEGIEPEVIGRKEEEQEETS